MTTQPNLNLLRRGDRYCATTSHGSQTGEYLGIETPHDEWAILIRTERETASIPLSNITDVVVA